MSRSTAARPLRSLCLSGLLGLLTGAAHARVDWGSPGHYRLRVAHVGDVPGVPQGPNLVASHRLRIEPTVELHVVHIHMQLDVLTGQIAGDTTTLGDRLGERRHGDPTRSTDGWTTVEPRLFEIRLELPWLSAQLGQLAAHRGLGLVDNDGSERQSPDGLERFGDRINGDIVDRAAVQVRPWWRSLSDVMRGLALGGGADWVYQDDRTSLLDDDSAWRAFATLDWRGDALEAGARGLLRRSVDRRARESEVALVDVWAQAAIPVHPWRATVHLAGDLAITDAGALGLVTRTALAWRRLSLGVDAGYASGGAAPFTFDPDLRVGLVLFDEVRRQQSMAVAEADRNAAPPDPRPTDGAVRDAAFFHPLVSWRLPDWRFGVGSLAAWRADGEWLGLEHAVTVHHLIDFAAFGVQAGMFTPGEIIGGPHHPPIARVVGRVDLRW